MQEVRVLTVAVAVVGDHIFIFQLLLKLLIPFPCVVGTFGLLQFIKQDFVLVDDLR